ncbi:MAG TPA: RES family NAD+ phosphorylase [Thiohalobacter sp.]|nr:RES family NAD+ phosphorylase [Thiohalobacter sp.]
MDIWSACRAAAVPAPLAGELIRLVESQEQVATNALVDSLAEQALLEQLLEASKPPPAPGTEGLHYLLATPFRYPPLRHGSRFGARFEPSLFYGALELGAALAETAYYRCVFWSGMTRPPPGGRLTTEHTLFGARYAAARGLRLQAPPFDHFEAGLTDPASYTTTQALGRELRGAGIDGFEYRSARDPESGINIALFHPGALAEPAPAWQQPWLCDTRAEGVAFYSKEHGTAWQFPRVLFEVGGRLPTPAV